MACSFLPKSVACSCLIAVKSAFRFEATGFYKIRWGLLLLLCLFLLPFTQPVTQAQTPTNACGFDLLHQQRLQIDSLYRIEVERVRQRSMDKANIDMTTVYTIPVVFVVYHLGEPVGISSNVSDQTLLDALSNLNKDFRATNPPYPANPGTDVNIQFALARRTPDCQATNGIIRVNASSVPGYVNSGVIYGSFGNGSIEQQLRQLTPGYSLGGANDNGFITIHIVHTMSGAAAYAGFGGTMFCASWAMGAFAHEMGHLFNLPHTFDGSGTATPNVFVCPPNANPEVDGDGIADTDPHKQDARCQNTGYDTHINECTGRPFGTILYNLMSYSCGNQFTPGQITRMRTALQRSMPSLINSPFLIALNPTEYIRPMSCSVTTGVSSIGYDNGITRVRFNTIDHSSSAVPAYYGYYHDYSCLRKTVVESGITYQLTTTLYYTNNLRVYIDYNNDGTFNETTELAATRTNPSSYGFNTDVSIPITIATSAVRNTYLRMRVISSVGTTLPTACYLPGQTFIYGGSIGEAEDYAVLILPSECPIMATLQSGNWSDPTVWSCNQIPTYADDVRIEAGHTLTLNGTGYAKRLTINGKLLYGATGQLRLAVQPPPLLSLSGDLNFGQVIVGQTVSRTLVIENIASPVMITGLTLPSGFSGIASGTLATGGSMPVVISFSSSTTGVFNGSVVVNSTPTATGHSLVLSATAITAATALTNGLVMHLPFSGNATDASGNGNHGIVTGPTLTTDRFGQANQAYAFSRSGGHYIRVPNSMGLDMTSWAMTICAWIKPDWGIQVGTNMQILSKAQDASSAGRKFGVGTGSPTLMNVELRTSTGTFDQNWSCINCTLQPNVWQFVTVTYDGSVIKWYKNGTLLYQIAKTGNIVSTTSDLIIGSFADRAQSYFNGSMDEIRIYNRALTDAEIQTLSQL